MNVRADSPARGLDPPPNHNTNGRNDAAAEAFLPIAEPLFEEPNLDLDLEDDAQLPVETFDYNRFPDLRIPLPDFNNKTPLELYTQFNILPSCLHDNLHDAWDEVFFRDLTGNVIHLTRSKFKKGNHPRTQERAFFTRYATTERMWVGTDTIVGELIALHVIHIEEEGGENKLKGHHNYPTFVAKNLQLKDVYMMLRQTGLWEKIQEAYKERLKKRRRENLGFQQQGHHGPPGTPSRYGRGPPDAALIAPTPIPGTPSYQAETERKKLELESERLEIQKSTGKRQFEFQERQLELDERRVATEEKNATSLSHLSTTVGSLSTTVGSQQQSIADKDATIADKDATIADLNRHPCLAPEVLCRQSGGDFNRAYDLAKFNNKLLLVSAQSRCPVSVHLTEGVWESPDVQRTIQQYDIVFAQFTESKRDFDGLVRLLNRFGIEFTLLMYPHVLLVDVQDYSVLCQFDCTAIHTIDAFTFVNRLEQLFTNKPDASNPNSGEINGDVNVPVAAGSTTRKISVAPKPTATKVRRPPKPPKTTKTQRRLKEQKKVWTPTVNEVVKVSRGTMAGETATVIGPGNTNDKYIVRFQDGQEKEYSKTSLGPIV